MAPSIDKRPGTGLKPRILVYVFLSLFLIASASASVNLTIVSSNNKTILVKSLDLTIVNETINNQAQALAYDNYIIDIKTNTSNLGFNGLFSNMSAMQKDFTFLILLIILIIILIYGTKLIKKMG